MAIFGESFLTMQHLWIIVFCIVFSIKSGRTNLMDPKVIGGNPVNDLEEYSYQVSLRAVTGQFFCSGTIINERHILTAAHCVCINDYALCPIPANAVLVIAGSKTLDNVPSDAVQARVQSIFVHSHYVKLTSMDDIAVIRVHKFKDIQMFWIGFRQYNKSKGISCIHPVHTTMCTPFVKLYPGPILVRPTNMTNMAAFQNLVKPLVFTNTIKSIPLAEYEPRDGTECLASGWGSTMESSSPSNELIKIAVSIMGHNDCARYYPVFYTHICAAGSRQELCHGDGGAPLRCNGELAGIASYTVCGHNGFPTGYTDVSKFREWITSQLERTTEAEILHYNWFLTTGSYIFTYAYTIVRMISYTIVTTRNNIFAVLRNVFPFFF